MYFICTLKMNIPLNVDNDIDICSLRLNQWGVNCVTPFMFKHTTRTWSLNAAQDHANVTVRKKMAACALRRGLLSIVSKYNKRHTPRVLSIVDSNGVFDTNRPSLQCHACGLSGGVQMRRFMSSR